MFMGGLGLMMAPLLVALATGYIVCYFAKKDSGTSQLVGYIIGVAVIALSAIAIIFSLMLSMRSYRKMNGMMANRPMMRMQQQQPPRVPPAPPVQQK